MQPHVRRWLRFTYTRQDDACQHDARGPLRRVATGAVLVNPYYGQC